MRGNEVVHNYDSGLPPSFPPPAVPTAAGFDDSAGDAAPRPPGITHDVREPPFSPPSRDVLVQRALNSDQPGLRAVKDAIRARVESYPHHEAPPASHVRGQDSGSMRGGSVGAPPAKISLGAKVAYALPEFSKLSVTMLLNVHAIAFFNEFGASLSVLSFFIALARSFDVLTDPLMGWFSDSTRSRYGRRRIYMAAFAPLYAGCLIGLMSVAPAFAGQEDRGARSVGIIAWFGCFYVAFYLFDTGANVPHGALGPELTDSQPERNRLFFLVGIFKMCGILFAAIAPVSVEYALSSGDLGCWAAEGSGGAAEEDEGVQWPSCELMARGLGLQYTSVALALWYVVAIALACLVIRERPASVSTRTPPLVPSLMATFRNKPFMAILPAWILDQLAVTMVTTMLYYFYTYIVRPEMTVECRAECTLDAAGAEWYEAYPDRDAQGRTVKSVLFPGCRSTFWCGTSAWIGLSIVMLITAAVVAQPIWLYMTTRIEKRNVWLLYNVVNALTNIAFVMVGEGDPVLCVIFVFFNGLPLGAQFLTDSIVADVIDYDEFLTGVRSEGRFTIGQSLLPKIVSVPAATVPLTLLVFLGFNPPDDQGRPQQQDPRVTIFIKVVFFGIPFACCVFSVLLKARFPLKSETIRRQVREGCALHMQGLPAVDPLTERISRPLELDAAELKQQWRLDHFFLHQLEQLYMRGPQPLVQRMRRNRIMFALALVACTVLCVMGLALGWIAKPSLAWVCVFSAMGAGLSLCFLLLAHARLRAAVKLQDQPVNKAFLGRLISLYQGDTNVESVSGVTADHVVAALGRWKGTRTARERTARLRSGEQVPLVDLMEALQHALRDAELPVVDASDAAAARAERLQITATNAAVLKRVVHQLGGEATGSRGPSPAARGPAGPRQSDPARWGDGRSTVEMTRAPSRDGGSGAGAWQPMPQWPMAALHATPSQPLASAAAAPMPDSPGPPPAVPPPPPPGPVALSAPGTSRGGAGAPAPLQHLDWPATHPTGLEGPATPANQGQGMPLMSTMVGDISVGLPPPPPAPAGGPPFPQSGGPNSQQPSSNPSLAPPLSRV
mmetsp:Transcript_2365/g.7173  ORF Transcript_2365/g.7173 Transcript_2365/m.7173 type:complete len:1068 (-) Transcript_2365:351-3554(-)